MCESHSCVMSLEKRDPEAMCNKHLKTLRDKKLCSQYFTKTKYSIKGNKSRKICNLHIEIVQKSTRRILVKNG